MFFCRSKKGRRCRRRRLFRDVFSAFVNVVLFCVCGLVFFCARVHLMFGTGVEVGTVGTELPYQTGCFLKRFVWICVSALKEDRKSC